MNDLLTAVIAVATPRVKTWFIIRRLFEPEEPSDVPASGGGDAVPHVTVKVENAVVDGGVKEVTRVLVLTFCHAVPYYTVSQKTVQNCFCQNFVKFPPIWIIFGRMMAKRLELCKVHSFSTSPNLRCLRRYCVKRRCSKLSHNAESCYLL